MKRLILSTLLAAALVHADGARAQDAAAESNLTDPVLNEGGTANAAEQNEVNAIKNAEHGDSAEAMDRNAERHRTHAERKADRKEGHQAAKTERKDGRENARDAAKDARKAGRKEARKSRRGAKGN